MILLSEPVAGPINRRSQGEQLSYEAAHMHGEVGGRLVAACDLP